MLIQSQIRAVGLAIVGIIALILLVALGFSLPLDLRISSLFYQDGRGFHWANLFIFRAVHWLATVGARALCIALAIGALVVCARHKPLLGLDRKAWLVLLCGLVLIPGLIVNIGIKDHWGRARPREIQEFGGASVATPAFSLPQSSQIANRKNGSFIAGDPAFGFFLTAFAYVVPRRRSRRVFWCGMAAGALCGLARIAMGAHFFSDVVYAAIITLGLLAILHGLFFNFRLTFSYWRLWFTEKA